MFAFLVANSPYRGSNEALGAILGCSARHAQRYITSLKDDLEVIEVHVTRHALGPSQWKNSRTITALREEI